MENQQVNSQENALQLAEGAESTFGQHPLESGGMGDANGGAPPLTPPPFNLGGGGSGPIQRNTGIEESSTNPNFSISESGEVTGGPETGNTEGGQSGEKSDTDGLSEVAGRPPSLIPNDNLRTMGLFFIYGLGSSLVVSYIDSFPDSASVDAGLDQFKLDMEADLTPADTAVPGGDGAIGADPGVPTDTIADMESELENAMREQMEAQMQAQMDAMMQAQQQAQADSQSNAQAKPENAPPQDVAVNANAAAQNTASFGPLDAAIASFKTDYAAFLADKSTYEALTEPDTTWEDTLISAYDATLELIVPLETTFPTIAAFPATLGLTTPLPQLLAEMIADVAEFKQSILDIKSGVQIIIDMESADVRAKRIAFRGKVSSEQGLEIFLTDLIYDHLVANGVDPADDTQYNFILGNGSDIEGTEGMDIIIAGEGDNTINGLGGADFIFSMEGNDVIFGGAGNDTIITGEGDDVIDGGSGSDVVSAGGEENVVVDREGDDNVGGFQGLGEGDTLVEDNEAPGGEDYADTQFGQAKGSLLGEIGATVGLDFFSNQFDGFKEQLDFALSEQELSTPLDIAQQTDHFLQPFEIAAGLDGDGGFQSSLFLADQLSLSVSEDFSRVEHFGVLQNEYLTLNTFRSIAVASTSLQAEVVDVQANASAGEQLALLDGYIAEFVLNYQTLQNARTLIQVAPYGADWESGLLAPIQSAIDAIGVLQSSYEQIEAVPGLLNVTVTVNEILASTMGQLTGTLLTALNTNQSSVQALLDRDGGDVRSQRVAFRERQHGLHGLPYDTVDTIFDFLLENEIDPLDETSYAIQVAGEGELRGGDGIDILVGGDGDNQFYGGGGNDLIIGGAGDDYIEGGAGQDTIVGGEGDDIIKGGDGNDLLNGGAGNDIIIGGAGLDELMGEGGEDLIHHEAGEVHDGEVHNGDEAEAILDEGDHNAISGDGLGVVDLSQGTFAPASAADASTITAAGEGGIMVPVSLGAGFEQVSIPIQSTASGYQTLAGPDTFIKAVNHPMTTIFGSFLDFGVRVTIANSAIQIVAETRIAGTEIALTQENLDTALQQADIGLNGLDFGLGDVGLDGVAFTNTYQDGNLNFLLDNLPMQIGESVRGSAQIGYINGSLQVNGNLDIHLGNGMTGSMELAYDGVQVSGSAFVEVNFGDVSGSIYVYYNTNGVDGLAGSGTGYVNTDKLNAELDLFFGPASWVDGLVNDKISTLGISRRPDEAGGPDLSTAPVAAPEGFTWAGIASGTVPIGESFQANANGILDSEGDFVLNLSIGQTQDIPLTNSESGSWGFKENYPVVDFGIPLIADVSANLIAGLNFGYNFGALTLGNARLRGTYAKAGNKYGVANTVDLGGTLSMDNEVDLTGTLGLGLVEHVLTQTGRIQLEADLTAQIKGSSSAEADIRAEFDEDGFHPHLNTVIDISQDLNVILEGSFFAQNEIKRWFRGNSVQTVEIYLGGVELHIGHMDLEMGYNSDAHDNKFSFGPPEGQDRVFQISSIEDMIDNIQTRPPRVTDFSFGDEPPQEGEVGDPTDLSDLELESEIESLRSAIDGDIDNLVDPEDQATFRVPDYGSGREGRVKTYKVLKGLAELYDLYDRYEDDQLTEEVLSGLISDIRSKHDVFTSLALVEGTNAVGEVYDVDEEADYLYWQWTASPGMSAPARKKVRLTIDKRYANPSGGRIRKPSFNQAIQGKDYISGGLPNYTYSGIAGAGGRLSTAMLGPTGSYLSSNSNANPNLPSYIVAARQKFPNSFLKAGHLLNEQFGGDGQNANNLTILSATGNSNHKKFDEPVKIALMDLRKAYEILWKDGIDPQKINLGIRVSVAVDTDDPWQGETKIFSSLNCTASLEYDDDLSNFFVDQANYTAYRNKVTEIVSKLAAATAAGNISNPQT